MNYKLLQSYIQKFNINSKRSLEKKLLEKKPFKKKRKKAFKKKFY